MCWKGMTLTELAARNGEGIEFLGFDWDYGGHVVDWHGGMLRGAASVTLCPPDFPKGGGPKAYPTGEPKISSALPVVVRYPPVVCAFDVGLHLPVGRPTASLISGR